MDKRQLKISYKLEVFGPLRFLIETKNPKLISILEYSDPEALRRRIVNEHINSTDPWITSIRDVLIKEMLEMYEKEIGRSFEWTSSGISSPGMFRGSGILYIIPTGKEINKRVKTKDWKWITDELGHGHWVETKRKRYHIGCFHKAEVVFLEIRRLNVTDNGGENVS